MSEAYLVIGRVIPERRGFRHESLRFETTDPASGKDACVIFRVEDGQLTASVVGDIGHLSNFILKNMVRQAEQTWLNAHTFVHGETFEVDIVGIIKNTFGRSDGSVDFHYQANLHSIIQNRERRVSSEIIWNLCLLQSGSHLRRALNDLRMALTYVQDAPFYCYRALETIRRAIGGRDHPNNRQAQWDRMWLILGGSRAEKDCFEKLAEAIRHGEDVAYPGADWRQAVLSTWDIVERYMLLLLREVRATSGPGSSETGRGL